MARAEKMYGNSPELKRGEDGNVGVQRPTKADGEDMGTDGMPVQLRQMHERRETHHRHAQEHHALHNRHEMEHATHEHGGGGHKADMHKRHAVEFGEMHKRHHGEMVAMHKRHEKEHGGGKAEPMKRVEAAA